MRAVAERKRDSPFGAVPKNIEPQFFRSPLAEQRICVHILGRESEGRFTQDSGPQWPTVAAGESRPRKGTEMKVSSSMMHVRDLDRSVQFYRDVFSCTTCLRTPDSALLLTPDGFQIYMHAKSAFRPVDAGVTGVLYIMWSTDTEDEFTQIAERMRVHDPSASVSTSDGLTLLDGRDPDGIRIVIAYPSPTQFPREVIAARFRG